MKASRCSTHTSHNLRLSPTPNTLLGHLKELYYVNTGNSDQAMAGPMGVGYRSANLCTEANVYNFLYLFLYKVVIPLQLIKNGFESKNMTLMVDVLWLKI